MERLHERLDVAQQALRTLLEVLAMDPGSTVVRDAAIQRFEYTYEAVWKAAQLYLEREESVSVGSPRGAIRESFNVGLLSEAQAVEALELAKDRNLTVHTYNLKLVEEIFTRLHRYAALLEHWLDGMTTRLGRKESSS